MQSTATGSDEFERATLGFVQLESVWMVYCYSKPNRTFVRRSDAMDWAVFLSKKTSSQASITKRGWGMISSACPKCGALFVKSKQTDRLVCLCHTEPRAKRSDSGSWSGDIENLPKEPVTRSKPPVTREPKGSDVAVSAHDRVRIAAKIIASPRTVHRVYAGGGNEYSRRRVTEAARELGLPDPPGPKHKTPT
jgi:uncharacterized Zn finger protein (UPF0148 family)